MMIGAPEPETLRARCTRCGSELWDRRGDQWTLRAAILKLVVDVGLVARCPERGCGADVALPFLVLVVPPVVPVLEERARQTTRRRVLALDGGRAPG